VHDFTRSEALPRPVVQALERACSGFARAAAASLSTHLRTSFQVKATPLRQVAYDQFVDSAPDPATIGVFTMGSVTGRGMLMLDREFGLWLVDYLLGGQGEVVAPKRPLTEVDKAVLHGVMSSLLTEFGVACEDLLHMEPQLAGIVDSPRQAEIAKAMEAVAMASFSLTGEAASGEMTICVPSLPLKLGAGGTGESGGESAPSDARSVRERVRAALCPIAVPCVVRLGLTAVSAAEVASLQEGDVLPLSTRADEDLEMLVAGRQKFRCRPVREGHRVAVRIVSQW
jgi:flagellar motor switch protein FliM